MVSLASGASGASGSESGGEAAAEGGALLVPGVPIVPSGAGGTGGGRPGATVRSSVTNLTNTILGAGMLGMPQAMRNSGLLLGLVILGCMAGLSIASINVLQVSATKLPAGTVASYYELSKAAFPKATYGPWPVRVTTAILALASFSYMCCFMIIIADTAAPLVYVQTHHRTAAPFPQGWRVWGVGGWGWGWGSFP